jgi:hypothetical protein
MSQNDFSLHGSLPAFLSLHPLLPPTLSAHPLHTFGTQGSPDVMDAPAIAFRLYQTFPNLTRVKADYYNNEAWTLVRDILHSISFIQNQSRQFKD